MVILQFSFLTMIDTLRFVIESKDLERSRFFQSICLYKFSYPRAVQVRYRTS